MVGWGECGVPGAMGDVSSWGRVEWHRVGKGRTGAPVGIIVPVRPVRSPLLAADEARWSWEVPNERHLSQPPCSTPLV